VGASDAVAEMYGYLPFTPGWTSLHHRLMATADGVRTIALSLPETDEQASYGGRPSFRVRKKGFATLRPDGISITVYVGGLDEKEPLLASDPRKFFTEPHYEGYPMVLVRYAEVDVDELTELLTDSWRLRYRRPFPRGRALAVLPTDVGDVDRHGVVT